MMFSPRVDLGEAIRAVLDQHFSVLPPVHVPTADEAATDVRTMVDQLIKDLGGTRLAAPAIGVDRRTLQRIRKGQHARPTPRTMGKLRAAFDRQRDRLLAELSAQRERERTRIAADLARKGGPLKLEGRVCVSNDCRNKRKVDVSSRFSQHTREGIVREYTRGDLGAAAARFERGLERDYEAGGMYVVDVAEMVWS